MSTEKENRPTHPSTCVFTIGAKNYLSAARTFFASLRRYHPEVSPYLILCDRIDGYFNPAKEEFSVIPAEDLGIPQFLELAFKYTCVELNTAVKPFAMQMFFGKRGFERVLYFDPDIVVYRALDELFALLDAHDVVLTPHLTDFLPEDGCLPDNLRILQTGANNLGCIAMRRAERAEALLRWWCNQLHDKCRHALPAGLFYDQRWMDLALGCVESSALLRHPGYNVAYWNLPHRPLTRDGGGEYRAAGEPLRFFHFSGYSPEEPQVISKHQTRLGWGTIGAAAQSLFEDYRQRLLANGFRDTSKWPCAYDRFLDGPEIPPCCRTYYQRRLLGAAGLDGDPFATSAAAPTVYDALRSPVDGEPVTGAALALYDCRPDLQQVFPQVPGSDCLEYARWFVQDGAEQAGIDPAFVEPVRSLLAWESRPAGVTATTTFSRGFPSAVAAVARRIFRWAQKQRRLARCFSPKLRQKVRKILEGVAFPSPSNHRPRAPAHARPTASPGTLKMGINLFGFLERPTGLGMAARAMAECFQAVTLPCHPIPLDERAMLCGEPLPPTVWPDEQLAINYCHLNADCTASLVHVFGHKPFAGHFNIGFWAWELEEFPTRWDHMFDLYQEIWVPSCFVQQAVSQRARIPVVRIPHCVAVAPPDRDYRDHFALPRNRPAVLVMFDTGSFSERKNPLAAIHAVKRAAAAGHDPLLVIKIGRPELQAPLLQELAREVRHVDCKIIHGWLSREETLGLISACDLLVSLHRSEGFGLILAEAMGLGKPVVATGYSGNMDFMNTANSFLVNYALTTLDRDIGPYPAGFRWAEPDIQHAADLIGRILEDPQHAAAMGRRAAGDIAAQLSPEAVGRQIRQRLNLLGFSAAGNPRQPASASAHYDSGVMKMLPGEKVATLDVRAA